MTHEDAGDYSKKHGSQDKPDARLAAALQEHIQGGQISCSPAFKVVAALGATAAEVGKTIDLLNIKLGKCQLGLFGYSPERSIVKPAESVAPELEQAIRGQLVNGRLPCAGAWKIAEELRIKKLDVSCAAEALKIKITPCQLGAF